MKYVCLVEVWKAEIITASWAPTLITFNGEFPQINLNLV